MHLSTGWTSRFLQPFAHLNSCGITHRAWSVPELDFQLFFWLWRIWTLIMAFASRRHFTKSARSRTRLSNTTWWKHFFLVLEAKCLNSLEFYTNRGSISVKCRLCRQTLQEDALQRQKSWCDGDGSSTETTVEMLKSWWKLFQAKDWDNVFPVFLGEGGALGKQTQGASSVVDGLAFPILFCWTSQ